MMKAYPSDQPDAEEQRKLSRSLGKERQVLTVFKVSKGKRGRIVELFRSSHRESNNNDHEQASMKAGLELEDNFRVDARNVEENIKVLQPSDSLRSRTCHDGVRDQNSAVDAAVSKIKLRAG
jgi:hypothetical protein